MWIKAASTQQVTDGGILAAFIVVLLAIVIITFLFVRNRVQIERQQRTSSLLDLVVPAHISRELVSHVKVRDDGTTVLQGKLIARKHLRVALCFIDICDFTAISSAMTPDSAVRVLDEFFTLLDDLIEKHASVVKIKTIGDAYFAVAGLANDRTASARSDATVDADSDDARSTANLLALIEFCLDVQQSIAEHRFSVPEARAVGNVDTNRRRTSDNADVDDAEEQRSRAIVHEMFGAADGSLRMRVRIGIHCGDVVAGVVGRKQPVEKCVGLLLLVV